MRLKSNFEIIHIADEHIAVPVGDQATSFKGVVALSEPCAFLLEHMQEHRTAEELINLLLSEYDVDPITIKEDFNKVITNLIDMGLVEN